eukprot:177202-Chlamydomonas_euryale.AAC.1
MLRLCAPARCLAACQVSVMTADEDAFEVDPVFATATGFDMDEESSGACREGGSQGWGACVCVCLPRPRAAAWTRRA